MREVGLCDTPERVKYEIRFPQEQYLEFLGQIVSVEAHSWTSSWHLLLLTPYTPPAVLLKLHFKCMSVTCYSCKLHFSASNLLQLQYSLKVSSYFWSYLQQRLEYDTRNVGLLMNNGDQIM